MYVYISLYKYVLLSLQREAIAALRAAFGNRDRAVEYLSSVSFSYPHIFMRMIQVSHILFLEVITAPLKSQYDWT